MALPLTPDSMGNVLRLQGLKNVSGRRKVHPGSQFLQEMNDVDTDVSGIGQAAPEANVPELEMGNELTPQSYDVRANEVIPPEDPSVQEVGDDPEENVFTRLGRSMATQGQLGKMNATPPVAPQTPPIETQEVDLEEDVPPVSASQQAAAGIPTPESGGGVWSAISDYFNPKKREEMAASNDELIKDARIRAEGRNPQEVRGQEQAQLAQQQQIDQEELNRAQQTPWEVSVYGATDAFAKQPELVREFNEYTGMDFNPQIKEATEKYEKVLSDIDKGLNDQDTGYDDQTKRIKERILSNQSTDADKFYIGMALLMPLLVGGLFGKEAGVRALGGTAEGFGKVLQGRQKQINEDESLLADITKSKGDLGMKRGELEIKRLELPASVRKNLPEDEFGDLKGMDIVTMKDTETGDVIGAGPEVFPDLVANLKYYNTAEKRKKMSEEAHKLNTDKKFLKQANTATKKVIDAAKQLDQPGLLAKALSVAMSEGVDAGGVSLGPNAIKKLFKNTLSQTIKDENGRDVNAAVYLDTAIEQLKDAYRRNESMRAFTQTVAGHLGSMAENPLYSGLTPEDLITQMLTLRDRSQQIFVDSLEGNGFYPQPMIQEFGRQNKEIYKGLNQRAESTQIESDKQKLFQSE